MKSNSGRHLILTAFESYSNVYVHTHAHIFTYKNNTVNAGWCEFYITKYCISFHSNTVFYHAI